jgi:hypothetical protein
MTASTSSRNVTWCVLLAACGSDRTDETRSAPAPRCAMIGRYDLVVADHASHMVFELPDPMTRYRPTRGLSPEAAAEQAKWWFDTQLQVVLAAPVPALGIELDTTFLVAADRQACTLVLNMNATGVLLELRLAVDPATRAVTGELTGGRRKPARVTGRHSP